MSVTLRKATDGDLEFLLSLVPRLSEFGLPPSRDAKALDNFTRDSLQKTFDGSVVSSIFVAEQEGQRLGFIQLEEDKEFFSGEPYAYIANLAITQEAEGKGVGKFLMQAAEKWAKEKGYRFISLYVLELITMREIFTRNLVMTKIRSNLQNLSTKTWMAKQKANPASATETGCFTNVSVF
jgi:GNAT superfamily N-acetyltransferase